MIKGSQEAPAATSLRHGRVAGGYREIVCFYLKSPDPRHGNHPSCEYEKMRKKGWTKLDQPFNQIKHTTKARGKSRKQTCPWSRSVQSHSVFRLYFGAPLSWYLSNGDAVAAQVVVVLKARPRHRIIVFAHSQKAAERNDSVRDLAAYFIDHHPLHSSNLSIIATVNRRTLDFVAADQRHGFTT